HGGLSRLLIGDVQGYANGLVPGPGQRLGRRLGGLGVDVGDGDGRASLGQRPAVRSADTAGPAGDDCDLATEIETHCFSFTLHWLLWAGGQDATTASIDNDASGTESAVGATTTLTAGGSLGIAFRSPANSASAWSGRVRTARTRSARERSEPPSAAACWSRSRISRTSAPVSPRVAGDATWLPSQSRPPSSTASAWKPLPLPRAATGRLSAACSGRRMRNCISIRGAPSSCPKAPSRRGSAKPLDGITVRVGGPDGIAAAMATATSSRSPGS